MICENRHLPDNATLNKHRKVTSEAPTQELPILSNHEILHHHSSRSPSPLQSRCPACFSPRSRGSRPSSSGLPTSTPLVTPRPPSPPPRPPSPQPRPPSPPPRPPLSIFEEFTGLQITPSTSIANANFLSTTTYYLKSNILDGSVMIYNVPRNGYNLATGRIGDQRYA